MLVVFIHFNYFQTTVIPAILLFISVSNQVKGDQVYDRR
jgi:hypothetical protein